MKWHSIVFSDESSFYLYVSDGHTHVRCRPDERHLLECIRTQHTSPTSGFMVWEAISYNSRSHLVFLQRKVNSFRCFAEVVNPVLLQFLQHKSDLLFQQDNA